MESYLDQCITYASLGYEVSLVHIYGKQAIMMVKRYSHPAEGPVHCQQIIDHSRMYDNDRVHDILQLLYDDIQEQENTGKYREIM